jgi:WD40 repeat-containing protein SMU1
MSTNELTLDRTQIINILQQFLKESNLTKTLLTLQKESKISFTSQEFIEKFEERDYLGCLHEIVTTETKPSLLVDLYAFIIKDYIQQGHIQGAKILLTKTEPMMIMREQDPTRYLELEANLRNTSTKTTELELSIQRLKIANNLRKQIPCIPPNRLVTLLGQALKHQVSVGMLDLNDPIDLYTCQVPQSRKESDLPITRLYKTIKFPKKTIPECCGFSPDGGGLCLIIGYLFYHNPR